MGSRITGSGRGLEEGTIVMKTNGVFRIGKFDNFHNWYADCEELVYDEEKEDFVAISKSDFDPHYFVGGDII